MIDIPDFVFPTDTQGNKLCPRCKKLISKCDCPSYEPPKLKIKTSAPSIRLDKSGRKGKIVTLIEGLSPNEKILKELSRSLKTKTGSGGTYYVEGTFGTIEIQGDHKNVIQKFFKDQDIG
jgi:translation initiation factor 1